MLPWETGIGEPGHYDDWIDEIRFEDEDILSSNDEDIIEVSDEETGNDYETV